MRHIQKSIAEIGNNKWRAHPMCGDYAARTCPMWIGSWHACAETHRNSAHPAVRCSNRAPIAVKTSRATIRSIDASAIMDRDAIVIMIAPDLTKMTSSGDATGMPVSTQGEYARLTHHRVTLPPDIRERRFGEFAWFERTVLSEHTRGFPQPLVLCANAERSSHSEDRWTIWRPPFIALRLLTYSSGRCQR